MSKKKLKQGKLITSLDELAQCEWVFIHGKPFHRGWVSSWQFRMAAGYVNGRHARVGVRLTNGEYYAHLSDEQIRERFGEELHEICPWKHSGRSSTSICEGRYCDEALDCWKEEPVK